MCVCVCVYIFTIILYIYILDYILCLPRFFTMNQTTGLSHLQPTMGPPPAASFVKSLDLWHREGREMRAVDVLFGNGAAERHHLRLQRWENHGEAPNV